MSNENQALAEQLVQAWITLGLKHAVISPGSRNTPLILALHARRDALHVHRVLDERSAAFFALGLSRVCRAPTLICCTSGGAGTHYYPAIVEASRSGVPLLVLTADRPPELHRVGAPQTFDQHGLFGSHVRAFFWAAPLPSAHHTRWIQTLAAQSWRAATTGPVHLNLAFRKPLWNASPSDSSAHRPTPRIHSSPASLNTDAFSQLLTQLRTAKRGVIVAGTRESSQVDPGFSDAVHRLARSLGWPLIAEATSGVRFGQRHEQLIDLADLILRHPTIAASQRPDCVLQFGQAPTNRPVAEWLQSVGQGTTLLVDETGDFNDPAHGCADLYLAQPTQLCLALTAHLLPSTPSPWLSRWQRANHVVKELLADRPADGFWEGAIAQALVDALPVNALLHLSSSMPVRDINSYATCRSAPLHVASNRGLNGIDGLICTALGEATLWSPTFLLIGDLSFLHDVSGLHLARQLKTALTIVLIDNNGGGIFSQLPIATHPTAFAPYFQFSQDADVPALCQAFAVDYQLIVDINGLKDAVAAPSSQLRLLHLVVDPRHNQDRREAVIADVNRALESLL